MNTLPPDRQMLSRFAEIVFKHASPEGYVSLRAFPDGGSRGQKPLFVYPITLGDKYFLDVLVEHARRAAVSHVPAVFCPPVATFRDHKNAKTDNLREGVGLSVECDQSPLEARQSLEDILGPATVVVASGGEWTNPKTGEIEQKLHLYWRLKKPTATAEQHDMLKEARKLATELGGGDATNISIVHPIRWPGSWHRKGTPRLAKIVASSDSEIDLAETVERLRDATGAATFGVFGFKTDSKFRASDPAAVASALSVIPNDNLSWNDWNRIGMATWAATGGSEVGREAFADWSAKSPKNDKDTTEARWQHYKTSPPTKIGFGTLVWLARQHSPGWSYGGAEAKSGETSTEDEEQANTDPGALQLDDFYAYMPKHLYIFAPTGDMWPATSVNTRLPSVPMLKKDGTPVKDAKGKPRRRRPSVWLDKYRPVEQMTWAPGEPLAIDGRLIAEGGWIERPGVTTFNLYRPPVVQQGNAANVDRWLELVERLYSGDVEHIVRFCAHRIQYPAVKINHGLILSGAPGIGKDTILEPLRLGVGAWNFKEVSPQDIMGPHNDYMRCVVLRISEVRDLGEVNRYAFYEHMKSILATPPDVMRVNAKYIPQHYVVNVAGVILTTNHRFDGIYLPPDDRRHYVAGTDIKSMDFVNGFWPSFWDWYKTGGLADVVAYLSEYDLSKFDPKAPPRKTDAFWQIAGIGAAPEEAELADVLDALGARENARDAEGKPRGPTVTTLAKVLVEAKGGLYEWLSDRKNRRVIPHRFEACGYTPVRNYDAKDGLWVIGGKRQAVYGRLDVPLSERIEAAGKLK